MLFLDPARRGRARHCLAFGAAVALALRVVPPLSAAPGTNRPGATVPAAASVRLVAKPPLDPRVLDILTELLQRRGARLVVGTAGDGADVEVTVVDGRAGATITGRLPGRQETATRTVPRDRSADVYRETLAHAIYGLADAMGALPPVPTPPPVLPLPTPPPVPTPRPVPTPPPAEDRSPDARPARPASQRDATRSEPAAGEPAKAAPKTPARAHRPSLPSGPPLVGELRIAGGLDVLGDAAGYLVNAGGALRFPGVARARLSTQGHYAAFTGSSGGGLEASPSVVGARVGLSVALLHNDSVELEAGLAGVAELLLIDVSGDPPPRETAIQRLQVLGGPLVALRIHLDPNLDLRVAGLLDIDAAPRRLVVRERDRNVDLFTTSRARPALTLGLAWHRELR